MGKTERVKKKIRATERKAKTKVKRKRINWAKRRNCYKSCRKLQYKKRKKCYKRCRRAEYGILEFSFFFVSAILSIHEHLFVPLRIPRNTQIVTCAIVRIPRNTQIATCAILIIK